MSSKEEIAQRLLNRCEAIETSRKKIDEAVQAATPTTPISESNYRKQIEQCRRALISSQENARLRQEKYETEIDLLKKEIESLKEDLREMKNAEELFSSDTTSLQRDLKNALDWADKAKKLVKSVTEENQRLKKLVVSMKEGNAIAMDAANSVKVAESKTSDSSRQIKATRNNGQPARPFWNRSASVSLFDGKKNQRNQLGQRKQISGNSGEGPLTQNKGRKMLRTWSEQIATRFKRFDDIGEQARIRHAAKHTPNGRSKPAPTSNSANDRNKFTLKTISENKETLSSKKLDAETKVGKEIVSPILNNNDEKVENIDLIEEKKEMESTNEGQKIIDEKKENQNISKTNDEMVNKNVETKTNVSNSRNETDDDEELNEKSTSHDKLAQVEKGTSQSSSEKSNSEVTGATGSSNEEVSFTKNQVDPNDNAAETEAASISATAETEAGDVLPSKEVNETVDEIKAYNKPTSTEVKLAHSSISTKDVELPPSTESLSGTTAKTLDETMSIESGEVSN